MSHELSERDPDIIVIGSGIGGLTAAGLLAGVAGKRVLVLEQHTEPGGFTHAFRRDGASWDVGLHYVGQLAADSQMRKYFDYLSGARLEWNRMPDTFERFSYPELRLGVPSDPEQYRNELVKLFPDEAQSIDRYFRAVRRTVSWVSLGYMRAMVPRPVVPLLRFWENLTAGLATQTTAAVLKRLVPSPRLSALLATQWMDYGLPPRDSAFAMHAQIVGHYLNGAWYPKGGASRVARTFEIGIERTGGAVRVAQRVEQILIEEGRVAGVRVTDRRGAVPRERIYRAPIVISDAGADLTYDRLLPKSEQMDRLTAPHRAIVAELQSGQKGRLSVVTLYLRLRTSAASLGVRGENYWINADFDHDDIEAQTKGLLDGEPNRIYLSFPSLKSGEEHVPTAEIIACVDAAAFETWRGTTKGSRGADYLALKDRISTGMLSLADTALPGLRDLLEYAELSTPLTVEHYSMHPNGRIYGLPATPGRHRSDLLGPHTPVPGLFLAGADAGGLGIVGAMMGGVGAACQVLGAKGFPQIQAALKAMRSETPPGGAAVADLPLGKARATLTSRQLVTSNIMRLDFELDRELDAFAPGQFARIRVAEFDWRDYSIAAVHGHRVTFLISTRTGGTGSHFAANAPLGSQTIIEGPFGQFTLSASERRSVFIATGTGLAPFLPMFEQLGRAGMLDNASLYFGCRTTDDSIISQAQALPGHVVLCLSNMAGENLDAMSSEPHQTFNGRVTAAIETADFDLERTNFYICGSAAMVSDAHAILARRGAAQIITELY